MTKNTCIAAYEWTKDGGTIATLQVADTGEYRLVEYSDTGEYHRVETRSNTRLVAGGVNGLIIELDQRYGAHWCVPSKEF